MKIEKTARVILDEHEAKKIKHCLDYCFHRLTKHNCGLDGIVSEDAVDALRGGLEEALK